MKTWMCALMLALSTGASAQNPIISGQYSADPTARVFNGKRYLYPSHEHTESDRETEDLVLYA